MWGPDAREVEYDLEGQTMMMRRERSLGRTRGDRTCGASIVLLSLFFAGLVSVFFVEEEVQLRGGNTNNVVGLESLAGCSAEGDSCLETQCCSNPLHQCFQKNEFWATCMETCDPGLNSADEDGKPWRCKVLGTPAMWDRAKVKAMGIMQNLTQDQKVSLLRGENDGWPADRHGYAGYVGLGRTYLDPWMPHGVMPLSMNDGPQGYNSYGRFPSLSTQYPSLLSVAASFSSETSRKYATAIAEEFAAKGATVLLGPDVEITRAVLTGRSFETISGEDPFLGSQLVAPFVKAVQDHGIIVCVKHFLDNNQEIYRQSMNVEVGDRAQHEIYTPVFKAAFDAGATAVMCSYNKVYGTYACENSKLLKDLLRDDLGFKGFVLSDWGATHGAYASATAGLDIDMQKDDPKVRLQDSYHELPSLVENGTLTQETIDEKVVHVLSSMQVAGQFDGRFPLPEGWAKSSMGVQRGKQKQVVQTDTTNPEHTAVALQTIIDGAVLLKNEGNVLPLASGAKIALVGKYCSQTEDETIKQGSVFSGGGSGFVSTDKTVSIADAMTAGSFAGVTASVDAKGAAGADVAVVCVAAHSEEGWDRKDLAIPDAADLVSALRAQGPEQTIVVVASVPGAVSTSWIGEADAALILFEPGEQVGPAVAKLLTGEASPGGRLPVSFPADDEQRFTTKQYPGVCPPPKVWCPEMTANFSEGVLVGYRWNAAMHVASAFPFGFGLSYTDFEYSNFKIDCTDGDPVVSAEVTNTGNFAGDAVPQLYVSFPSLAPVVRQLRGFQKVSVPKGGTAKVAFQLSSSDWDYFDEATGTTMNAMAGKEVLTVSLGTSADDIVDSGTVCSATLSV